MSTLSTCCTRAPGPPGPRPPRWSCTSPCTWPPPTPRRSCPGCRSRRGCRPARCPRGCTASCRACRQRSPSGGCQSRPCSRRSPICRAATEPSVKFSQSWLKEPTSAFTFETLISVSRILHHSHPYFIYEVIMKYIRE